MTKTARISVIIPAYNADAFVHYAIESALAQTYPVLEILVMDDGSSDDTAAIVARYPSPVRLLQQQNAGVGRARNRCAQEATGDWFAFLDADDIWLPQKLERQMPYATDGDVGIVHCFAASRGYRAIADELTFDILWRRNAIGLSSVVVRREAFEQVNGFNEDRAMMCVEDYNLWLRIAAQGWRIVACPEELFRYTPAPGNLSSQVERFARAELLNIEDIAQKVALPPDKLSRKRLELYERYGQELFCARELSLARTMLTPVLLSSPTPGRLMWWLGTFVPQLILDYQRKLRKWAGATNQK